MSSTTITNGSASHPVASDGRWIEERTRLLAREKELTRLHDQVASERRALPWRRVTKDYAFDTPAGRRTLADLFGGHRQLLVQHFMFGPGWEQGCPSCSYMADHMDGMTIHLAHRDIGFAAVSRAPLPDLLRFRQRMGWKFDWVSSHGSDFNFDFGVSFTAEELATGEVPYNYRKGYFPAEEAPGISVFWRDDAGEVFHTYSTFGRGVEAMMGAYVLMDLTPQGRSERDVFYKMEWLRHHDRYEPGQRFEPAPEKAAVPAAACPHCTD
jgi:predicted dithiol-disulfide oxidoreductase (DUF899 family)